MCTWDFLLRHSQGSPEFEICRCCPIPWKARKDVDPTPDLSLIVSDCCPIALCVKVKEKEVHLCLYTYLCTIICTAVVEIQQGGLLLLLLIRLPIVPYTRSTTKYFRQFVSLILSFYTQSFERKNNIDRLPIPFYILINPTSSVRYEALGILNCICQ